MDFLEQLTMQKERELDAYLSRLDDPNLRQLLADLAALRRTREMAAGLVLPVSVQATESNGNGSGNAVPPNALTQGDAVAEILHKAGHPVHINQIATKLREQYGFQNVKKPNLNSIVRKDRRNRFVSTGNGHFALRTGEAARTDTKQVPYGGNSSLSNVGFSLIGAIKELVPTLQGEFSQPVVFKLLTEKYPKAAPHLQKASVATTLRKLSEDGLIEETYHGFGSDPRRYRRRG